MIKTTLARLPRITAFLSFTWSKNKTIKNKLRTESTITNCLFCFCWWRRRSLFLNELNRLFLYSRFHFYQEEKDHYHFQLVNNSIRKNKFSFYVLFIAGQNNVEIETLLRAIRETAASDSNATTEDYYSFVRRWVSFEFRIIFFRSKMENWKSKIDRKIE